MRGNRKDRNKQVITFKEANERYNAGGESRLTIEQASTLLILIGENLEIIRDDFKTPRPTQTKARWQKMNAALEDLDFGLKALMVGYFIPEVLDDAKLESAIN
jgi:hypothetical protein